MYVVRICSFITSIYNTLFKKSAKNNNIKMKVTPSKFKPFVLVTRENEQTKQNEVVIVAGNTQMSPLTFETEEEAEAYLQEQPYEMFTNMYSIFKYYETEQAKANKKSLKVGKKEH